jgi:hypothetical protein
MVVRAGPYVNRGAIAHAGRASTAKRLSGGSRGEFPSDLRLGKADDLHNLARR